MESDRLPPEGPYAAAKRVFKWEIPVDDQWHKIPCRQPLHVGAVSATDPVLLWGEDRRPGDAPHRLFRVYGTGDPIPDWAWHVGTVQMASGLVWHVFECAMVPGPSSGEGRQE